MLGPQAAFFGIYLRLRWCQGDFRLQVRPRGSRSGTLVNKEAVRRSPGDCIVLGAVKHWFRVLAALQMSSKFMYEPGSISCKGAHSRQHTRIPQNDYKLCSSWQLKIQIQHSDEPSQDCGVLSLGWSKENQLSVGCCCRIRPPQGISHQIQNGWRSLLIFLSQAVPAVRTHIHAKVPEDIGT